MLAAGTQESFRTTFKINSKIYFEMRNSRILWKINLKFERFIRVTQDYNWLRRGLDWATKNTEIGTELSISKNFQNLIETSLMI